jgi:hypothetical protein
MGWELCRRRRPRLRNTFTDGTAILGTVSSGATCGGEFFITGNHKRVIVPDSCGGATDVYAYPAGGCALKTINGQSQPSGASSAMGS